jgi:hypothetical protein
MKNSGYQLIKHAIDRGMFVSVQDSQDRHNVFYRGNGLGKAWEEAQCMDEIIVEFYTDGQFDNRGYAGWAFLVHGNDPCETVSDYSMAEYSEWIDEWCSETEFGQA